MKNLPKTPSSKQTNLQVRVLQFFTARHHLPYTLALLPILFLVVLLVTKTVNVPYWDQWEFVPLIQHVHAGHFYFFTDFWHQHNEHRLLFPRIVMIVSATITHWNIRVESGISFTIALGSFVLLLKSLRHTQIQVKHAMPLLLPLLLGVIWFSPVQVENWFWGWQIQWFLSVSGIMLVIFALARINGKVLTYKNLLLILGGGILAQYSLGNGVIIWPLAIAALLYARVPLKKVLMVAATGITTTCLYYYHYVNLDPSPDAPKLLILKEPILFLKYMATYVGRSLTFLEIVTAILGVILLLVFAGVTLYLLLKRRTLFRAVLPWAVLGLYAAGSAAITAISRMGLGLGQAYSSRYTTVSLLLLVSTIIICIEAREDILRYLGSKRNIVVIVTLVFVVGCVLSNAAWGVHNILIRSRDLKANQQCLREPIVTDVCAQYAFPIKPILIERLNYLKQIHWAGY
jgi:hypothetical protein